MMDKLEIETLTSGEKKIHTSRSRYSIVKLAGIGLPVACISIWLILQWTGGSGRDVDNLRPAKGSKAGNKGASSSIRSTSRRSILEDIPVCGEDLVVSIHTKEEEGCQGIRIRDDLIMTASDCADGAFLADVPGVGFIRAAPHSIETESDEGEGDFDSRVAFLKVVPPFHYQYMSTPVIRDRLFLSRRSNPAVKGGSENGTAVMTCNGTRPIFHNFPVDGKLLPVAPLYDILRKALWEHTDLETAAELSNGRQTWWARRITFEEEQTRQIDLFRKYIGPPGSIDIIRAHDDYLGMVTAFSEVEDPYIKGHRRECFQMYHERYMRESPFSGQSFFDWLDFGKARETSLLSHVGEVTDEERKKWENVTVTDKQIVKCQKNRFNQRIIHYFSRSERRSHEVNVTQSEDGNNLMLRYEHSGQPLYHSLESHPYLYVFGMDETLYIVDDSWDKELYGQIKHSCVFAGGPVLAAGKLGVGQNGTLLGINFSSGHYRPDINALTIIYRWFQKSGFNTTALNWVGRKTWTNTSCADFDWNQVALEPLEGYEPETLRSVCDEVTSSSTFMQKEDN